MLLEGIGYIRPQGQLRVSLSLVQSGKSLKNTIYGLYVLGSLKKITTMGGPMLSPSRRLVRCSLGMIGTLGKASTPNP